MTTIDLIFAQRVYFGILWETSKIQEIGRLDNGSPCTETASREVIETLIDLLETRSGVQEEWISVIKEERDILYDLSLELSSTKLGKVIAPHLDISLSMKVRCYSLQTQKFRNPLCMKLNTNTFLFNCTWKCLLLRDTQNQL